MNVKQRLVCPKCGKGFIVNPTPEGECVHFLGEPYSRVMHGVRIPHCESCKKIYSISVDEESLEFTITDYPR